jgi:hypothetical protein
MFAVLALVAALLAGPEWWFETRTPLYSDDFSHGLAQWSVELEKPGIVQARNGILSLDVPAGCTVWFRPELRAPVSIEYEATMVSRGGANDRVSDLNCFWMARDARSKNLFAVQRSGRFADYNQLRTYYVGQGGNSNTTTRFRRYIGDAELRPLLPEHDLSSPDVLLRAGTPVKVRLVASGGRVQYYNGDRLIFDYRDPQPYERGRFALRTTWSHVEIRNFHVYRVK